MVDALGLLLVVMVTVASVQDRDGGRDVLARLRAALPGVSLVWADGGYAGKLVEWAKLALSLLVDIVRKRDGQRGFEVLPRRWVVERTLDHQLSPAGLRLRADDRTLRSDGQVGDDRADGAPAGPSGNWYPTGLQLVRSNHDQRFRDTF